MDKEVGSRSEHQKQFVNNLAEKLGVPPEKVAAAARSVRKE